jgi:Fe-S cluster assembly iron-binding protein IscA
VTRDAREVERKKVGLHSARRRKQFSSADRPLGLSLLSSRLRAVLLFSSIDRSAARSAHSPLHERRCENIRQMPDHRLHGQPGRRRSPKKQSRSQTARVRAGRRCSGFQYGFTFDEITNEDDTTMTERRVLLIDAMSYQYLVAPRSTTEDLRRPFVIKNPPPHRGRIRPRPDVLGRALQ